MKLNNTLSFVVILFLSVSIYLFVKKINVENFENYDELNWKKINVNFDKTQLNILEKVRNKWGWNLNKIHRNTRESFFVKYYNEEANKLGVENIKTYKDIKLFYNNKQLPNLIFNYAPWNIIRDRCCFNIETSAKSKYIQGNNDGYVYRKNRQGQLEVIKIDEFKKYELNNKFIEFKNNNSLNNKNKLINFINEIKQFPSLNMEIKHVEDEIRKIELNKKLNEIDEILKNIKKSLNNKVDTSNFTSLQDKVNELNNLKNLLNNKVDTSKFTSLQDKVNELNNIKELNNLKNSLNNKVDTSNFTSLQDKVNTLNFTLLQYSEVNPFLKNKTKTGEVCQAWGENGKIVTSPHKPNKLTINAYKNKTHGLGDHNYCRDPDNSGAPWCYTMNENKRWYWC